MIAGYTPLWIQVSTAILLGSLGLAVVSLVAVGCMNLLAMREDTKQDAREHEIENRLRAERVERDIRAMRAKELGDGSDIHIVEATVIRDKARDTRYNQ